MKRTVIAALLAAVALAGRLPPERRESCVGDFEQAEFSWLRLLRRHLRASVRPSFVEKLMRIAGRDRAAISIAYRDAPEALRGERDALMAARALEKARDFAQESFSFPRPIAIEARACGRPDASWDPQARRLELCYEMVAALRALEKGAP